MADGLAGIASGVDTATIVSQLMALERQSLTRLQVNQSRLQVRDTGLKDVQSKLSALKSAAQALRSPEMWASKQTVESSDPTRVGVALKGGAGIGGATLDVIALANSSQRSYGFTSAAADRTLTVTPSAAGSTPSSIAVPANATLDEVAASINANTDLAVFAAVVVPDPAAPTVKQLVLSSRTTGSTSGFTASLSDGGLAEVAGKARTGADAQYKLNGSPTILTSPSNVVENAIPGVSLTLKAPTTTGPVSINVGAPAVDKEAAKTKIRSFVTAYNAVISTTRAKTNEKSVPDATTAADKLKGQLFGDTGLNSMLDGLRRSVTDAVPGNSAAFDALADLGISTGAAGAGKVADGGALVIDEAKLTSALDADPTAVRRLLGGISGTEGFAQRVEGLVDRQVGSSGAIDMRLTSSVAEQKRITDTMTRTDARLLEREKRLKAQFAAMESALQASQTQQAWLTGQLAALNASTS
jgi:flagellar hook-associated protein 2